MVHKMFSKEYLGRMLAGAVLASSSLSSGIVVLADQTPSGVNTPSSTTTSSSPSTPTTSNSTTPTTDNTSNPGTSDSQTVNGTASGGTTVTSSVYGTTDTGTGKQPAAQVPTSISLVTAPGSVTTNGQTTVTGTVYDQNNRPIPGMGITLAASAGSLQDHSLTTDNYGAFQTTFTAPPNPGSVTVTASVYNDQRVSGAVSIPVTIDQTDTTQAIQIPDGNLEQAIRGALNKPTGAITLGDLASLTSLTMPGDGIRDLTGLQYATNLQSLNISNNSVSDISELSTLTKLTSLDIGNNPISNFGPIRNLSNLTTLSAYDTSLSQAGLNIIGGLTNLQGLWIGGTYISDLSLLSQLTNLTSLNILGAGISDISSLQSLTNLVTLNLSENQISDISSLRSLTHLEALFLSNNNISDVSSLASLLNLKSVMIDQNQIDLTDPTQMAAINTFISNGASVVYQPQNSTSTGPQGMTLQVSPSSVQAGGAVTVTGSVYDDKQAGIGGVGVTLNFSDSSLVPQTVTTDVYGKFSATVTAPNHQGEDVMVNASAVDAYQVQASGSFTVTGSSQDSTGITGTVKDSAGQPAVGVTVVATAQDGSTVTAATDQDGNYVLYVPVGTYALSTVEATERGTNTGVVVADGQMTSADISMQAILGVLTGTVTDSASGEKVGQSGTVTLLDEKGQYVDQTQTKPDGSYEFDSLQPGTYSIQVQVGLDQTKVNSISVEAGQTQVSDVTLAVASIHGTVTDDTGKPVAGATVTAANPNWTWGPWNTTTAPDGSYMLFVPNGTFTVVASNGHLGGSQTNVSVTDGISTKADISLSQQGGIHGTVHDATGAALPNANVQVVDSQNHTVMTTQTDSNGNYTVTVPEGAYTVIVNMGPQQYGQSVANVTAGNDTTTDVEVDNASITGTVTDAKNRPVSNATVSLLDQYGTFVTSVQTSADGTYRLDVAPGNYTLQALQGFDMGTRSNLVVSQGQTAHVNLVLTQSTGIVTGQVTSAQTGKALTNVPGGVQVVALDSDSNMVAETWVHDTGQYSLNLPAGTYQVLAQMTSGKSQQATVIVSAKETSRANLSVNLTAIQGTVTDGQGNPVPGATVKLTRNDGSNTMYQASTDDAGNYLAYVPDGNYTVKAVNGDYSQGTASATVSVSEGDISTANLQLANAVGAIFGIVTNANTGAGFQTEVEVKNDQNVVVDTVLTDSQGYYSVFEPVGTYTVTASRGQATASQTVAVSAGKTETADIAVAVSGISGRVTNADGSKSIPNANITITDANGAMTQLTSVAPDGSFEADLPAGTYTIAVTSGSLSKTLTNVEVTDGQTTNLLVPLTQETGDITGSYMDYTATTSSQTTINLVDENGNTVATTQTEMSGMFSFHHVASGNYTVVSADHTDISAPVNVIAGQTAMVKLGVYPDTISGIVKDAVGNPVGAGVTVQALASNGNYVMSSTVTNADGSYNLGISAGTWTITAVNGYQTGSVSNVLVQDGQNTTQDINLSQVDGVINASVTDLQGNPLSIWVEVDDSNGNSVYSGVLPDGNLTLPLPEGHYTLSGRNFSGNFGGTLFTQGVDVTSGQTIQVPVQVSFTGIRGVVTDASGEPVGNTQVTVTDANGNSQWTWTGPDGTFMMPVQSGNYLIQAEQNGFSGSQFTTVPDGSTASVNLMLNQGESTVSGTIVDTQGNPATYANVQLLDSNGHTIKSLWSEDGTYTFTIPAGTYTIAVDSNNRLASATVTLKPQQTMTKDLQLVETGVTGTVTLPTGSPLSGAEVQLWDSTGTFVSSFTTHGSGQFTLDVSQAGDYTIQVQNWDRNTNQYDTVATVPVTISDGKLTKVSVVAQVTGVQGKVTVAGTGIGLPYTSGQITTAAGAYVSNVYTDQSGNFLATLPAGDYTLLMYGGNSGTPAAQPFTVVDGQITVQNVSVAVTGVAGVVQDSNGTPMAGVTVTESSDQGTYSTQSGPDGSYLFMLPAGSYVISATSGKLSATPQEVTVTDGSAAVQNLTLDQSTSTISGTITGGDGYSWYTLKLLDDNGNVVGQTSGYPGSQPYQFSVTAGTYTLVAQSGSYYAEQTVTVDAGTSTTADLTLQETGVSGVIETANGHTPLNASIQVNDKDGHYVTYAYSNADGTFKVDLAPGTYTLVATFQGSAIGSPDTVTQQVTVANGKMATQNLDMPFTGVSGKVTNGANGVALPTYVQFYQDGQYIGEAYTNSDGTYLLDLPAGTYSARVNVNGQSMEQTVVVADQQVANGDLAVQGLTGIGGTLLRTDGTPATNVHIYARDPETGNYVGYATVGSDGSYMIFVPAGSYTLSAEDLPSGMYTSVSGISVADGETTTQNLTLSEQEATIKVVVTNATANKSSDYTNISVQDAYGNVVRSSWATFNTNGTTSYTFTVPAGTYSIQAQSNSVFKASTSVQVADGDSKDEDLTLTQFGISGQLTDSTTNQPIRNTWIEVDDANNGNSWVTSGYVDANGNFNIPLQAGTYTLVVRIGANLTFRSDAITVSDTVSTYNWSIATRGISGTVTDANNKPVTDARVEVYDSNNMLVTSMYVNTSDGTFSFDVPDGTYSLKVYAGSLTTEQDNVVVNGGMTSQNVAFNVGLGTLSGTVTDADSKLGVPWVTVKVKTSDGTVIGTTQAGYNGKYVITDVPVGTYTVSVDASQHHSTSQDGVTISEDGPTSLDLTLESTTHQTTANDGDWTLQHVVLYNTPEADVMARTGDIDNLGFGWPDNYDPFSGASTLAHAYPWTPDPNDAQGTDRIEVVSSYTGTNPPGYVDGYSTTTNRPANSVQPVVLTYDLQGTTVQSAILQMFVDDFQAPLTGAKYTVTINGQEAPFLEDVINRLDQSGPIGKLITVSIPDKFLPLVSSGSLSINIDDTTTGAGDGYAIDFAKLLVNPNPKGFTHLAMVSGTLTDAKTGNAIANVTVSAAGYSTTTDDTGHYTLTVPAGIVFVTFSKDGYTDMTQQLDNVQGAQITVNVQDLSDADAVNDATSALADGQIINDNQDLNSVTTDLTLPTTGMEGTTITWSSDHTDIVANSGKVTRPTKTDTTVTLTATITKGQATSTKQFTVTVIAPTQSKAATASNILVTNNPADTNDSIEVHGLHTGDVVKVYDAATNGTLLATSQPVPQGQTVAYLSIPELGNDGGTIYVSVTSPQDSESDITPKSFPAAGPTAKESVDAEKAALVDSVILNGNADLSNVTSDLNLPIYGVDGTTISWSSSAQSVLADDGSVTQPPYGGADKDVILTATIAKGSVSEIVHFNVTVKHITNPVGTLKVQVLDDANGSPLAGAVVLIQFPDRTSRKATTDPQGYASVSAPKGSYKIFAYETNYKPLAVTVSMSEGQVVNQEVRLTQTPIVVSKTDVTPMTLAQIEAAGINTSDPANQHVFKYEVHLAFNTQQPVTFMLNGAGQVVGGGGGGSTGGSGGGGAGGNVALPPMDGGGGTVIYPVVIPVPDHPEVAPTVAYLVIPAKASWLKEFFNVSLQVSNNADADFPIENANVTLNLPQGLSLAHTADGQSLSINLAELAGGTNKQVNWIIRGDTPGEYTINADFTGILEPFDQPLEVPLESSQPFHVWGGDALKLHVQQDAVAVAGQPYTVKFGIENVSDTPVYNLNLQMLQDGAQNFTFPNGESLTQQVTELDAGQTQWFTFTITPTISGTLDLSKSFILQTGDESTVPTDFNYITGNGGSGGDNGGNGGDNGGGGTTTTTSIQLNTSSGTIVTGSEKTVTGTVYGTNGPLANATITLNVTGGTLSPTTVVTGADGIFTVTFIAPETPGPVTLTASMNTGKQPVTVTSSLTVVPNETGTPTPPKVTPVKDTDYVVKGQGEPGTTVAVKKGDTVLGTVQVGSDGQFSVAIAAQNTGTVLTVTSMNAQGVSSPPVTLVVWGDHCFIATAAFGSKFEPNVVLLRQFRDSYLLTNKPGQAFVKLYYKTSPPIARFIVGSETKKAIVRSLLSPAVKGVQALFAAKDK